MPYVVQQLEPLRWQVSDQAGSVLGEARAWLRPDRRCMVRLPRDVPGAWGDLAAALTTEAAAPLLVSVSAEDDAQFSALRRAGFRRKRLEQHWRIPVNNVLARLTQTVRHPDRDPAHDHTRGAHAYEFVNARHTDLERLCALDNEIRGDIPGTAGWVGTVAELADSLDDDEFDPELYLVARARVDGAYVGLIRVWNRQPHPRIGCLGVVRAHRRTSLCLQLVVAVSTPLVDRGIEAVTTETDLSNSASHTMARRMGAEPTGISAEWEYPVAQYRSAATADD